jgi:hypothetical protein
MPGRREIRIVYVTSGPSAGSASPALSVANGNNNAQTSWQINGERVTHSVYSVPANLDHTELSMGLAAGPFREAASRSYVPTAPATKRSGPAIFGELHDEGGTCFVDIDQTKWPSGDWRIEAILSDGKRVASSSYRSTGQNDATATFPCRKDQVVRIAWMQRDYQWQSIGQVPLRAPATAPTTQVASGGNDGSITGKGP